MNSPLQETVKRPLRASAFISWTELVLFDLSQLFLLVAHGNHQAPVPLRYAHNARDTQQFLFLSVFNIFPSKTGRTLMGTLRFPVQSKASELLLILIVFF